MFTTTSNITTADSSPKWFTTIELDPRSVWTESTIEYVPTLSFDDSKFTRVLLRTHGSGATPLPTPVAQR